MEVLPGPVVVLGGAELMLLGRQAARAIRAGWTVRGKPPPRELLDFAIAVNRLTAGTSGTGHGTSGQVRRPLRNRGTRGERRTREHQGSRHERSRSKRQRRQRRSATRMLRRLVRKGALEVQDSQWPIAIYADSLAAWQERRRRMVNDRRVA